MLARLAGPLRRAAAPRCHRWLSTTLPRRASFPEFPSPDDPAASEAIERSPVFQKIAANPEAFQAVFKFLAIMEAQGLDTDKPPSEVQLFKLYLKSEVREAFKEIKGVFQKLDIELIDKNLWQELTELSKSSGAAKK